MKKIPTTIYDPPPEFQDNYKYPQTTVLRSSSYIQSYAQRLTQNIISKAITSLAHTRCNPVYCLKHSKSKKSLHQKTSGQEHFARKKIMNNNIYDSDSFLNSIYNSLSNINRVDPDYEIYDEPNTENDVIYKDNKNTVLCKKRIVRSLEKKAESRGGHLYSNTDDLHCNTNTKSNSCHNNQNYNLSNNIQSNSFQKKFDKFLRSKFLTTNLTPTTTTSSILYSYCHAAGTNLSSGNPNSRNSLNSRLSSSHNSLTVTTANKADDSIFITQAMSHDALQLGHHIEISDFYNVPIDSDIYTLPIDVINQPHLSTDDKEQQQQHQQQKSRAMSDNNLLNSSNRSHKIHRSKNKRSKRKKRTDNVHKELHSILDGQSTHQTTKSKIYRNAKSKRFSVPENSHTSMNLSLDEVKKYYNNLYSTSSESVSDVVNFSTRKSSSSNLKHVTSTQTFSANKKSCVANKTKSKNVISSKSGAIAKEDVGGGNKNGHTMKEQNDTNETLSPRFIKGDTNNNNNSNSKYGSNSNVKKSQFSISLNLKQKFCSIFRFKKSQHTSSCIANSNLPQPPPAAAQAVPPQNEPDQLINNSSTSVDKKVKLSTRALPPLPAGLCKLMLILIEKFCLIIDCI